jgi:hypothetical protein
MLLVDEGWTSAQVSSELEKEIPFKSLLTRKIPAKLGGSGTSHAKKQPSVITGKSCI